MSNTELYYAQLTDLSVRIAVGIKNRTKPLDELSQALTQLSQTNAIKGNAADAMKAYISEVHMTLIQTLMLLLNNYEMALGKYVKGYLEVDSNENFKLVKEDFDAHERNLSSHRLDFTSIGSQLKAISEEAEDIIWLGGAGSNRLFNVAKEMDAMKKTVSDLNDRWNSYEQTDPGFNQVQNLIAQTKALLKSTLSVPRGYSYSPGSFSKLISKNFLDAFEANANYAQNPDNQKAFQDDWNSISKNYTADQKRMAEEAKEKAQKEGLIGLVWDGLQICAGTALVVTGVGTGFGVILIAGGVNSAINHASMAVTGKSFNIVGNLTNGALQWYNKNIGNPLVKTGNPIAKFVAGLGNGAIEVAGGMGQFSVYDMGKTVRTLVANPQARAQFGASVGNWWNQVRSGDAYTIGQTTAAVASLFVGGEDIGAAASKASKVDSLLGKIGTFSKSVVVSSVENVKSLLTKVKGTLSDFGTASVTFAKTFGKTFAEESGKYANTCFDAIGAAATSVKIGGEAFTAGVKDAKSALRMVKDGEDGFADGVDKVESTLDPKLGKYVQDSFEGVGKEVQDNFNKYLRENVWCDETLSNAEKIDIMKANFDKLTAEQKINFNVSNEVKVLKNPDYSNWGEWPDIDWPDFPGLNKDTAKSVYNEATGKIEIPNDLDRLGSPYGNNLGVVENGYHCTQDERSICYVENEYAKNGYKFDGTYYKDTIDAIKDFDIDNPQKSVNKINSIIDSLNMKNGTDNLHITENDVADWLFNYKQFQSTPDLIKLCNETGIDSTYGVMGEAAPWTIKGDLITSGGAGQINTPINVKALEDIGIMRNVGGW